MKQFFLLYCILFLYASAAAQAVPPNVFIITTDGFRWQEVFTGADSQLISNPKFTRDTALARMLYWDDTPEGRRRKLLPFFWNVIAAGGQLHGNRYHGSRVNVTNPYKISYAGYSELLTGTADLRLFSNRKTWNRNISILEKLNSHPAYRGKVAAFSSWDVFPCILNSARSHIPISSGYDSSSLHLQESTVQQLTARVQQQDVHRQQATRHDELTFVTAVDYIQQRQPRIVYLSFGETDEYAHSGRYDLYLQSANRFDRMLQEL